MIIVEDGEMRHGRKSRSLLIDGYKRHVLCDLDSRLIVVVGATPASVPEASVTDLLRSLWSESVTKWSGCGQDVRSLSRYISRQRYGEVGR